MSFKIWNSLSKNGHSFCSINMTLKKIQLFFCKFFESRYSFSDELWNLISFFITGLHFYLFSVIKFYLLNANYFLLRLFCFANLVYEWSNSYDNGINDTSQKYNLLYESQVSHNFRIYRKLAVRFIVTVFKWQPYISGLWFLSLVLRDWHFHWTSTNKLANQRSGKKQVLHVRASVTSKQRRYRNLDSHSRISFNNETRLHQLHRQFGLLAFVEAVVDLNSLF